tara:strand:+ start:3077 stop:4069 length:993 start_codon:yes stop_codon:yes gene_type:complete
MENWIMVKREYGGYLPLELQTFKDEYYTTNSDFNVVPLNSGRATFFFAAKEEKIKKIFLPYFTCAETGDPFKKLNVDIEYYLLDDDLLPKNVATSKGDFVFWTNYYGNAHSSQIKEISSNFENLIIDNCHAFFSLPVKGAFNCYSTRKFFGVSDGAYLIKDNFTLSQKFENDFSYQNSIHLVKQHDAGVNAGYQQSLRNEERLSNNYMGMSKFTKKILKSINYKEVHGKRLRNFLVLHDALHSINEFRINLESETHMYYPFLIEQEDLRYKLIEKKLYNPFWWKHVIELVPSSSIEYRLSKYTVMLPIDQRYTENDMSQIGEIVKSAIIK